MSEPEIDFLEEEAPEEVVETEVVETPEPVAETVETPVEPAPEVPTTPEPKEEHVPLAALKAQELEVKRAELEVKQFEAETDRIQVLKPEPPPAQHQPYGG